MGIEIKIIIPDYILDNSSEHIDIEYFKCPYYAPIVYNGTCRFCMKIHN